MPRARHRSEQRRGRVTRWLAGATGLACAAAAVMTFGTAAGASPAPSPHYHAGSDTATFTVAGVVDANCPISTGGTEVWIKPGDKVNFKSGLAGISVAGLGLDLGPIAGLNVSAVIDQGTSHQQTLSVAGGKTTVFPSSSQRALSTGDHTLAWTANSLAALSILGLPLNVPLTSSALKSGASLSWQGVIHVTSNAPQCKLAVGTPKIDITAGPIHVTVPPINVGVPLPNIQLPGVGSGNTTTTHPKTSTNPKSGKNATTGNPFKLGPAQIPISELVVPKGDGAYVPGSGGYVGSDGSGYGGVLASLIGGSDTPLPNVANGKAIAAGTPNAASNTSAKPAGQQVDAAKQAPSGQMPVILAIIAIIALSLVTATYARLYLLRKQ